MAVATVRDRKTLALWLNGLERCNADASCGCGGGPEGSKGTATTHSSHVIVDTMSLSAVQGLTEARIEACAGGVLRHPSAFGSLLRSLLQTPPTRPRRRDKAIGEAASNTAFCSLSTGTRHPYLWSA